MSLAAKLFGDESSRFVRDHKQLVERINQLESEFTGLELPQFKEKTADFKQRVTESPLDNILPEAFALVREASKRVLNQRHFDVQLLGGLILHQGKIAEMKTGEGKTLVATLAAYLNALTGKGVHIVTVNDYLSRRDAVWMGQIYNLLGLTVGVINNSTSYLYDSGHVPETADKLRDTTGGFHVVYEFLRPCSRREAYQADITYGSNTEFGFDYLRDHLAYNSANVVQALPGREYNYAIVDEVDSVLIDEARTPLIISAPVAESDSFYKTFSKIAKGLKPGEDYTVDEKQKAISLTEVGISKVEQELGIENLYTEAGIKQVHHLETAVRAQAIFLRDRDYVVRGGEVVIVDEFTGRLQPGRRWSDGLHQAIEAKEGVLIKEESKTYASITLQNYFKLYKKLSGMTGTAATSAEEFTKVYGLGVIVVPTNKPSQRQDLTDLVFQTEEAKFRAVSKRISELNQLGQPVLVGTVSIEKSEKLSLYLRQAGIPHKILNAKNHEEEGQIIAEAGKKGSVVIATNMAGRGVDIKLGGTSADEAKYNQIRQLGGLFVLGTERHDARRIDNQLRGRSGRQGDPGTTRFFLSFEDTLVRVFVPDKVKGVIRRLGLPESEPIEHRMVARAIESAQKKIEGLNFDTRKHLFEYDNVLNHQRAAIYNRREGILFGSRDELNSLLADYRIPSTIADEELRRVMLSVIDSFWVDHLEAMEYLKQNVRLRAYGQRDPFVEYKREGLELFRTLEDTIDKNTVEALKKLVEKQESYATLRVDPGPAFANFTFSGGKIDNSTPSRGLAVVKADDKVGRNDPCPCGSGKKYKKCHGG